MKPDPTNDEHIALAWASPAGWAWFCSDGEYQYPPHVRAMDDEIMELFRLGGGRILFEMPPQIGKTRFMRYVVGWFYGRWPDRSVIYATHTKALVDRAGAYIRRDIEAAGKQVFGISLMADTRAKADFIVKAEGREGGGEFYGVGVGGSPHGRGANLLVTDDLVHSAEASRSELQMDAVEDFIRADLLSRRRDPYWHIGAQTRWSENDPHGIFTRLWPDKYRVLRFPALAEADDPLGRKVGEALWPAHQSLAFYEEQRAGLHPYHWSALYQQRPTPEEGGLWRRAWWAGKTYDVAEDPQGERWMNTYDGLSIPLRECIVFVVVDLATTTKKSSDHTAILACALTPEAPRRLVLLDLDMRRVEAPEINPSVYRMIDRWGAAVAYYETQGNQAWGHQYATRDGIPVRSIGTAQDCDVRIPADKEAVVYNGAPFVAKGLLLVPRDAPWVPEWEHQLLVFPNAEHDECSDVTAWACHVAMQVAQGSLVLQQGRTPKEPALTARDRFLRETSAVFDEEDGMTGRVPWRDHEGTVDLDRFFGSSPGV